MPRISDQGLYWGQQYADAAMAVFGLLLGEQAVELRTAQVIPAPDGRLTRALAEVFERQRAEARKERDMKRVNLNLKIVATLTDAETGKVEPVPFDAEMTFNYRGVPYADGLDVQESFARAMSEHGQRMIDKGRKHAEDQKAKA